MPPEILASGSPEGIMVAVSCDRTSAVEIMTTANTSWIVFIETDNP
jgi:hypothetical protein